MKVLNEYPGSHHYWEEYEKTQWYCMNCGKQEVWDETGAGDYYCGTTSYCTACGHRAYYMGGSTTCKEPNELKRLEQLRTGVTHEPTTRKGT